MKVLPLLFFSILFFVACQSGIESPTENNKTTSEDTAMSRSTAKVEKTETNQNDLSQFVIDGYEIMDSLWADLNNDQREDMLLALKQENEPESSDMEGSVYRPLLILLRQKDGSLKKVRQNNYTILCRDCGGVLGEPYSQMVAKGNYFSVEHHGGSSQRWTKVVTYKYQEDDQEWYLHKDGGVNYSTHDPDLKMKETVQSSKDFGIIKFEDYNIYGK